MKLLCVIDSLGSGGAQRQMVSLARGLKTRGYDIEFFIYYAENHYQPLLVESNIPVHLHLKSSRYSVAPIIGLRRLIRNRRFDIVISFLDTPNLYAEIANLGIGGAKLVISKRSSYPQGKLTLQFRIIQEFHRFAHAITVNSHHQRERMEGEFYWMRKKILTIYNGVDLDVFRPVYTRKKSVNNLSLVAISSVSFNKNTLNLAKALVICKEKYKIQVTVNWIGVQQVSDEGTRPTDETNSFLNKSGLSGYWKWHGVRNDISQVLVSHDALIHPSYFEGLPNVICEALACGRPVLASRVCDNSNLVQEGVSGFLFDPDLPADIAQTINKFNTKTLPQRDEMGKAARKYAEKHLSCDQFVSKYEELLEYLSVEIGSAKASR
jgi:glycosyltransferase involved in cell wall biosynthesis